MQEDTQNDINPPKEEEKMGDEEEKKGEEEPYAMEPLLERQQSNIGRANTFGDILMQNTQARS